VTETEELELLHLLEAEARAKDLELFAGDRLLIKPKVPGELVPLRFNRAQRFVHQRLQDQLARVGMVRAIILKARQQGFSTYIGARFYWRAIHAEGLEVFILTHSQGATDNLFDMVDRFQRNNPEPPTVGAANAKELTFPILGSGYSVGTAGMSEVGRSRTIQLLHGSEAAYWKNAANHFAGVVQAVPRAPGTEVILESTGNGPAGEFYERWQQAEAGVGEYEAIFVPWFWSDEYRAEAPAGFALDDEEEELAGRFGLDPEQMAWRRIKLAELRDPMRFMREYPATANEAFMAADADSFIKPEAVLRARKATIEGIGPLILGVDPKREGHDRFAIAWRKGRCVSKVESDAAPVDAVTAAGRLKTIIDHDRPVAVFIDVGGQGGPIADMLRSWGEPYASLVKEINFASAPLESVRILADGSKRPGPKNRRAEMWEKSRDWLDEPGGADIPDRDSLQADACAPGYLYDLNQRLQLESKEKMASRGVRSPDEWDAVALTFAEPVAEPRPRRNPDRGYLGPNSWMAS
jgi:hypothetical protein